MTVNRETVMMKLNPIDVEVNLHYGPVSVNESIDFILNS